jgi:hypothetical protein
MNGDEQDNNNPEDEIGNWAAAGGPGCPLSTLGGRLSVGKPFEQLCNAGWWGHVSDLFVRQIVPPPAIFGTPD